MVGIPCIYVVTGQAVFVALVLEGLGGTQSVIVGLVRNFWQSERLQYKEWVNGIKLLAHKELGDIGLHNHLCGGATDGRFQFGSEHGLEALTRCLHTCRM